MMHTKRICARVRGGTGIIRFGRVGERRGGARACVHHSTQVCACNKTNLGMVNRWHVSSDRTDGSTLYSLCETGQLVMLTILQANVERR